MNLDDIIELDDENIEEVEETEEGKETEESSTDDISTEETEDSDSSEQEDVDESAVAYFEYLKENNILDLPEEFKFDGTAESVQEALKVTDQRKEAKAYQTIWNHLPDDFKPLLDYGLRGGKSLQEYLDVYAADNFDNYDLTDPISQKLVIEQYYRLMNPTATDDKISKWVERREQLGNLEEEAADALEFIKEKQEENRRNFLAEQEQRQQAELKSKQAAEENLKNSISKFEADSLRKSRLQQLFFTPNKDVSEFDEKLDHIYSNPEHLVQLGDIIADYDPRIGFTYDRLKRKFKTDSNKKFSDIIKTKTDTKSQLKGTHRTSAEDFDLEK